MRAAWTVPSSPAAKSCRTASVDGEKRSMWAIMRVTPALSAAAIMSRHSCMLLPIGFSTRVCLPASATAITIGAWVS